MLKGIPGLNPAGTLDTAYSLSIKLMIFDIRLTFWLRWYFAEKSTIKLLFTLFWDGIDPVPATVLKASTYLPLIAKLNFSVSKAAVRAN
jgi:hypothetical protein